MRLASKLTAFFIAVAIFCTVLPINTAQALSLSDLVAPTTGEANSQASVKSSTGNNLWDMLLGIILGTFIGKGVSPDKNTNGLPPSSSLTKNKELIGFMAEWWDGDKASFNSLKENSSQIQTLSPFWATLNEDGIISNRSGSDHASVVQYAHAKKMPVMLLVNNAKEEKNGTLPIHTVLRTQELRSKSISSIETYIKQYGLDGVNIDFESVPAEDKAYLSAFMRELSARLKPQGYIVSIDVFPKQDESNDVAAAYDYTELAKYADKIIIMTYDNHGMWSGPGAIADIRWVESSLKYALQFIPKNKLYLGVAAYGYDWSGKTTESVEYNQITQLIKQNNASVLWDEPSKSPYFSYTGSDGQKHQVWFENAESLKYKLDLVNRYNLAGAAMWRLGGEDPACWSVIREKLK